MKKRLYFKFLINKFFFRSIEELDTESEQISFFLKKNLRLKPPTQQSLCFQHISTFRGIENQTNLFSEFFDKKYNRRASVLFRSLDRKYRLHLKRQKNDSSNELLLFTLRFLNPLKLGAVGNRRYRASVMPELMDELIASTATTNGSVDDTLHLETEESDYSKKWNATKLLNKLYHVRLFFY